MIAIIDYQMGNLRSVQKAFEFLGQSAQITSDHDEILRADRVVLPGVGAFRDAIAELRARALDQTLQAYVASGKPVLGVCLGMQLLLGTSHEYGTYTGLNLIPGDVNRFAIDRQFKVPHIGWNQAQVPPENASLTRHPVFAPLRDTPAHFYFVHSFCCVPVDSHTIALQSDYGGLFCAALAYENIIATQFHPEKSQTAGLSLLERFCHWNP